MKWDSAGFMIQAKHVSDSSESNIIQYTWPICSITLLDLKKVLKKSLKLMQNP